MRDGDYPNVHASSGGRCLDENGPSCGVTCRHNLALDGEALPTASRPYTCVLKQARLGPMTLEEIGQVLGVTRERIRQIEHKAKRRFDRKMALLNLRREDCVDAPATPARRTGRGRRP